MSYRVWWLLAFWALGVGVAIELEPQGRREGEPQAEARALPPPVAARPAVNKGG